MSQPVGFVRLIQKFFPQRFLLARLTHIPLIARVVDHLLFEGDDIIYLPQDRVIPEGRSAASMTTFFRA